MSTSWLIAFSLLGAVVIVQAIALIGLQAKIGIVLTRVEGFLGSVDLEERFRGLPIGALAPALPARRIAGSPARLGHAATLLLFTEADCNPCDALLRQLCDHLEPLPDVQPVLVAQPTAKHPAPSLPAQWTVLVQEDRAASRAYQISAVPYAYVIDERGKITAAGIPNSVTDLLTLCTNSRAPAGEQSPLATVAHGELSPSEGGR